MYYVFTIHIIYILYNHLSFETHLKLAFNNIWKTIELLRKLQSLAQMFVLLTLFIYDG